MRINAARLVLRIHLLWVFTDAKWRLASESLTRCNGQNGIQASITGMLCPLLKLVSGCATRVVGAYSGLSPHLQGQSVCLLSRPDWGSRRN